MDLTFWRDLSIIWLSIGCFVAMLIPIIIFYLLVVGMNKLSNGLLSLLKTGQGYSHAARTRTEGLSQRAVKPVLYINRRMAKIDRIFQTLWPKDRSN